MANNWSMTRFEQEIQNNSQAQKAYGWLKFGQTYQQFTQSITANKAALEQRYGIGNANATTALNDLNHPLVGFGSYGAAIAEPSTTNSTLGAGQNHVVIGHRHAPLALDLNDPTDEAVGRSAGDQLLA